MKMFDAWDEGKHLFVYGAHQNGCRRRRCRGTGECDDETRADDHDDRTGCGGLGRAVYSDAIADPDHVGLSPRLQSGSNLRPVGRDVHADDRVVYGRGRGDGAAGHQTLGTGLYTDLHDDLPAGEYDRLGQDVSGQFAAVLHAGHV